ncbi:hypothetical protein KOAAANKH_03648 [Brevundimonas sp. NIBR10]|uniref:calcium-binding protein n=1 Tax=Brevundimonas sp. NIBR10 TaxID=3015997 RepID=UPI0022F183ED|nr:M10 family metallopeptidase C-terminal domain-containing protein [Brevundimonas sp. NIBR10]WGM48741.1 hypothetical protein KOAAANKH_03648 [Brevundimonas sp. NIBR10]
MSRAVLMNGADRPEVMVVQDTTGDRAWAAIADDALSGTDGDDRTFFTSPALDGGAGFDTIDFSNRIVFDGEYYGYLTLRPGETPGSVAVWTSNFVRGGSAPDSLVGSFTNFEQILLGYRMSVALQDTTQDWSVTGFDISFTYIATGSGNDTITGGSTDDSLSPGAGSNTVHGGRGDDTVTLTVAYADSVVTQSGGVLRIQTGTAVNLLTGVEHVVFTDRFLGLSQDGVIAPAVRRVSIREGAAPLTATAGADIMIGYVSTDILDGLAGDDWLYGASGVDTLKGGLGNDYIDGGVESRYDIAVDTAVFEGNFADYSFSLSNGIWTVSGAASGTDRVTNIETFRFADRSITVGPSGLVQTGTEGADTLTGTTGPDELSGLGGDDRLDAGSRALENTAPITTVINSSDILRGGAGNDTLTSQGISNGSILDGGDGDDTITAGWSGTWQRQALGLNNSREVYTSVAGDVVTILGGAGSDRIRAYSNAVIDGGAGDDVITVGVPSANSQFYPLYTAGAANGGVRVTGGSGADTFVLFNPLSEAVITDFQVGIDRIDASDSFDSATVLREYRLILGQQGADAVIMSFDGSRVLARLVGVDAASLGASTFLDNAYGDPIFVGLYAPIRAPYIDPARIYSAGTEGADTLSGLTLAMGMGGDDVISAGATSSVLGGGIGNDRLTGSARDDILRGNDGADLLVGGAGSDQLFGGLGTDRIQGGLGADTLWGGVGSSAPVTDPYAIPRDEADVFVFTSAADSNADGYDIISDFQEGLDTIDLTALTTSQITIIRTGSTSSFLFATTASGTLQVGSTSAFNGRDLVYAGTQGVTMLALGSTRAELYGSERGDTITGGLGDDLIWGQGGADVLTGGEGRDAFNFALSDSTAGSSDIITDFRTGVDRISLGQNGWNLVTVTIVRSNGSSFLFADGSLGGALQVGLAGAELNGRDVLTNWIRGSLGVTLLGSASGETLIGSAESDVIVGGDGADLITGGGGADIIRYAATSDSTAAAYDVITDFATGSDRFDLTPLNTTSISVIRSGGSSFVYAETPAGGFQLIALNQAVNGNDFVYGGSHGVYLIGSADADILRGTSLADPIAGGAGNDTITGGGGADALFGDAGADTFVYVAASDSTVAAADGIFGFVSGQDRIDLTGVRTGASDTFGIAYLGTGSFVFVDLGGNGTNDMLIQLADTRLLASDIRWSASGTEPEPALKDAGPDVLPVEWVDDGNLTGPITWTGRYMLDLDTVTTGGLHHTPDWYL